MCIRDRYVDLGLPLVTAINAKEAGIYNVWQRLSYGKMKVFKSLSNWLSEFRLYRRDEKGQVVKVNDHLMDCTRYLSMTASEIMITEPFNKEPEEDSHIAPGGHAWMS